MKRDSFEEALKQDVLAGRLPEMNDGDKARYETEEAARQAADKAELERRVDEAIERAKREGIL